METIPFIPEWGTWLATCAAGTLVLGLLARGFEALLDLDIG